MSHNFQNIKKYFRNQSPLGNLSSFSSFTDSFFLPNKNSLFGHSERKLEEILEKLNYNSVDKDKIEWKRISEMQNFKDFTLFGERLDFDCEWDYSPFHIILSNIVKYPQLILNLFRNMTLNPLGYYEICLFIEGEWQMVIIDDYIPVIKIEEGDKVTYEYIFNKKDDNNSLWVILLEKAWSKVNETYVNIFSKSTYENNHLLNAFHTLTSFPFEQFQIMKDKSEGQWENIKLALERGDSVFALATKAKEKYMLNNGLMSEISYNIVYYRECELKNEKLRLLVIKNKNYSRWQGVWSENSHRWNEETTRLLGKENNSYKDCFFMDFDDFIFLFSYFTVCKFINSYFTYSIKNENLNEEENMTPHVYNLYLQENTKIIFSFLTQNFPFFITLAKMDEKKNTFKVINSKYSQNELSDIHFEQLLESGLYIIWVYYNCNKDICAEPKPQNYTLRIFSPSENLNLIKHSSKDKKFTLIAEMFKNTIYADNSEDIVSWSDDLYFKSKSQFMKSGIGYLFINNNTSLKDYLVEIDTSDVENMTLINVGSSSERNNTFLVNKMSKFIILAIVKNPSQKFAFDISYKYTYSNASKPKEILDCKQFIDAKVKSEKINVNSIDSNDKQFYLTNDIYSENIQMRSEKYLSEDAKYEIIKGKYPEIEEFYEKSNLPALKFCIIEEYDNGTYTGQKNVRENLKEGVGVYVWKSGERYIGTWKDNIQDGVGIQFDVNGEINYKGGYCKGIKSGKGWLRLSNGDIYEGDFEDDSFNGEGNYKWAESGQSWQGRFVGDKQSGCGLLIFPDGSSQTLEFK